MVQIERSALVLHSAEKMYDLVNSVADYADFLPGVVKTHIIDSSASQMRASMTLKRAGVSTEFITCNELVRPESIMMNLESGPFKSLKGIWRFQSLGEMGCKVSLDLTFEPENKLVGGLAATMMSHIGGQLVDDFCKQATKLYG